LDSERFACTGCGGCCRWPGHVLLRGEEIAPLARATGLGEEEFLGRYTRLATNRAQLSLVENSRGECVFLEGSRCVVYEARPKQCRDYPYLWRTGDDCPGIGNGSD